jgi:hypothetical protein
MRSHGMQTRSQPTMAPGREREIFEVLLSSPLLGAAEALALLGTCKDARGVGRAASLDAVRAVCTKQPRVKAPKAIGVEELLAGGGRALEFEDAPCVVPQVYVLQSRTRHTRARLNETKYMHREREEWVLESTVSVAEGASARTANYNAHLIGITPADSSSDLLVAILSRCTNMVSLRLNFDYHCMKDEEWEVEDEEDE